MLNLIHLFKQSNQKYFSVLENFERFHQITTKDENDYNGVVIRP
jgi:hypothetical protein